MSFCRCGKDLPASPRPSGLPIRLRKGPPGERRALRGAHRATRPRTGQPDPELIQLKPNRRMHSASAVLARALVPRT